MRRMAVWRVWARAAALGAGLGACAGLGASSGAPGFAPAWAETAAPAELAAQTAGPAITEFTLSNGMRAVVIEDHRAPVVTHMVWYRVGAADEPPGVSGVAHYLEHLMFKATDELASGEFSKVVAANGGQDNAFTSLDYTAYFQRVATDRLGLMMRMEADRMVDLRLEVDETLRERDVILEERSQRTDSSAEARFSEQFNAALYMNHPYGVPVIGWRHEMEQLSREDALDFYKRFYAPELATLVVAGDVNPDEVRALAEHHYGVIPNRGLKPYERPKEPPHLAPRIVRMVDPQVRQPFVSRAYLAPTYTQGLRRAAAMDIFSDVLGSGATSRLYRALVRERKIAISAGAYFNGDARDIGAFGVWAVPADGVSLADLEAAIDAELAAYIAEGPSAEEVERAVNKAVASRIYAQDSQQSMARLYGAGVTIGLTVEEITTFPQVLRSLTRDEIAAVGALIDINQSVTGWLEAPTAVTAPPAVEEAAVEEAAVKEAEPVEAAAIESKPQGAADGADNAEAADGAKAPDAGDANTDAAEADAKKPEAAGANQETQQ